MSYTPEATTFEPPPDAEAFYAECLQLLNASGIPFAVFEI